MSRLLGLCFFAFLFALNSCKWLESQEFQEKPLCRVYDDYLLPSDLKGLVQTNSSEEDSIRIVERYVDFWIKQRLMLQKAKQNIQIDKASLKRKVDDYKNTLIIYDYEQAMLQEKLDTTVRKSEVEDYYENNQQNFITKTHWVKVDFVKIDPKAPKIDSLPIWLNKSVPKYREHLSDFCYQYAEEFTLDTTKWYDFEIILQNVPIIAPDPALYLKYRKYAQVQDSLHAYYLKIHDFRLKGGNKPLRLVEDNIKHLIINKRQQSFLEKLRNNVYNSAINNEFDIF